MRIALSVIIICWTFLLRAQTNPYLTDLNALKTILQKTPSYKAQIKGDKLTLYNNLYNRLVADTVNNVSSYKYFYNLAQLLFPLKDNHLGFHQIPNYENFKTEASIEKFVATKAFSDYPKYAINLDSLQSALAAKPAESIEGLYHYDRYYKVGLFKRSDKEYIGVVVETEVSLWQKGQIAIHLYEYEPNLFKALYGHPLTKNFILQPIEKYRNQSLLNAYFYGSYSQNVYTKRLQKVDFVNLPKDDHKFEFKRIANDIQYLLIKTFQANQATIQKSTAFYNAIKDSLTAENLILDLRNNEGGSKKAANKYFQLIKQHVKKGQVFILLNNGTLSQAEILTLRLKKLKNITTIGQTTKGMLTYGSNYGKKEKLPSQQFEVYLTDMPGSAKLLKYEDVGINPDISLDEGSNWIDQVIEVIRKK